MTTVYIVSEHNFFIKDGTDYAMAFYEPNDCEVYSDLSRAMTKLSEIITNFCSVHGLDVRLPKEKYVIEDGIAYVSYKYQWKPNPYKYRKAFVITKKEVL